MMLTIIGGPMFAGKTTWLLDHVQDLPLDSFILLKPEMDTRYATNACVTHDGVEYPAQNLDHLQPKLPPLKPQVQTILIDELNFFSIKTLLPLISTLLAQERSVIGAGLLYDFAKEPFGATLPLSKKADRFIELFAVCDACGQPAQYNYSKVMMENKVKLAAAEVYGSCCGVCWPTLSSPKLK